MHQPEADHGMGGALRLVYLYRLLHLICTASGAGVDGTWILAGRYPFGEALCLGLAGLRGIRVPDLR